MESERSCRRTGPFRLVFRGENGATDGYRFPIRYFAAECQEI